MKDTFRAGITFHRHTAKMKKNSLIVDINYHDTKVWLWIQVCIWIYVWIDDNSVVELIGKIFIGG